MTNRIAIPVKTLLVAAQINSACIKPANDFDAAVGLEETLDREHGKVRVGGARNTAVVATEAARQTVLFL